MVGIALTTLDDFPLLWRWTQATHSVLPPDVLATIRALTPAAVDGQAAHAKAIWDAPRGPSVQHFEAPADKAAEVRKHLESLGLPLTTPIIVYWAMGFAVQTIWETFATYWDDFCYPSSDDVVVWSLSAPWTLCYGHHEWFDYRPEAVA
jgi:hypothetical protein